MNNPLTYGSLKLDLITTFVFGGFKPIVLIVLKITSETVSLHFFLLQSRLNASIVIRHSHAIDLYILHGADLHGHSTTGKRTDPSTLLFLSSAVTPILPSYHTVP